MKALDRPSLDPLLFGSPLRRPLVARLVITMLAALLLVAAAMSLLTFVGMGRAGTIVFVRALVLSSLLALVPLSVTWFLDRRERESPWLFAIAFLWGGVISAWVSLPINTMILLRIQQWVAQHPEAGDLLGVEAALMIGAPVAGPLVEETVKGLGVVLLFLLLRAEFDNMRDGFVYGALVGLGFNWVESALYVAQGYEEFGRAQFGLQLGARYALFGFAGHALFTGLFGAFLGLARQMRNPLRYLVPVAGWGVAVAVHALNNLLPLIGTLMAGAEGEPPPKIREAPPDMTFLQSWVSMSSLDLVVFLPFVVLLAWMLWRSGRWEREVIAAELASEGADTVTPAELRQIARDGLFRTRRIDDLHPRTSAALVRLQHELAFRKRRVRDRDRDPESDPLVARWREEIRLLRAHASAIERAS